MDNNDCDIISRTSRDKCTQVNERISNKPDNCAQERIVLLLKMFKHIRQITYRPKMTFVVYEIIQIFVHKCFI